MKIIKKLNKKNEFAHNMAREIFEEPELVERLISKHINLKKKSLVFKEFNGELKKIKKINRVLFLGCGTSYHAGMIGKYMMEEHAGVACEVEFADEFNMRKAGVNNRTLVIAISQSGRTADIIKAARLAKKQKALVLSITNGKNSRLDKIDDITVYNLAGEEKALAATKTFVSQIILLSMLAVFFGQARRKLSLSARARIIREIIRLPDKMEKILKQNTNIQIMANKYYKLENLLILGKNYHYPLAMEAALKLKEATYMHAEGFAGGEFLHGPLAISDRKRPVLLFMPIDKSYKEMKTLIKKLKVLKIKIIAVTTIGNRQLIKYADRTIYVPKTLDLLAPVLSIIPIQLFAYYIAVLKGINPDKPRNLKKFVG